jgi:hypothetical protein
MTLSASDVVSLSETDQFVVFGNTGDKVSSVGQGWTQAADTAINGQQCHTYTAQVAGVTATLIVDVDVTQVIN